MKKIENNYKIVKEDPLKLESTLQIMGLKFIASYDDAPRVQTNIAVRAGSKNDPADATGPMFRTYAF